MISLLTLAEKAEKYDQRCNKIGPNTPSGMTPVYLKAHDLLEIVIATAISLKISEQSRDALLWLLVVGAPSSDKTAIAQSLLDMPNIYYLDTLTENAFVSGYIPKDDSPTQDLLAELDGRCLVVKDYSTLFSLKADNIRKVLGDMQSIYDGSFSKFTGTRGKIEYQAKFSHVGCITPIALARHQNYMAMIGPRFLFYRVLPLGEDQRREGYEISWETLDRKTKVENVRKLVSAYGWQLYHSALELELETEGQKEEINSLVELLRLVECHRDRAER